MLTEHFNELVRGKSRPDTQLLFHEDPSTFGGSGWMVAVTKTASKTEPDCADFSLFLAELGGHSGAFISHAWAENGANERAGVVIPGVTGDTYATVRLKDEASTGLYHVVVYIGSSAIST